MRFKFINTILLILVIFSIFYSGCKPVEEFPIIPDIGFKSYEVFKNSQGKDTALILTITFKDGDGDIGLGDTDTFPPFDFGNRYYYNMYINYYEFIDSEFVEVTPNPFSDDTIRYKYRLPEEIIPQTNNKAIKGEISVKINDVLAKHNPVKFSVYIYDRKLHKSNVVECPELVYNN